MNEDLLKELKSTLPWLLVAALAVGGYYGFKNYRAQRSRAAAEAYVAAESVESLEVATADFAKSKVGFALKVKLAKAYYDAGRYQEALDLYRELKVNPPPSFAGIGEVGAAEALEGLGKYDEALSAYGDFAENNAEHPLVLTAKLGAARVTALKGDKTKALAMISALGESTDNEEDKARVTQLEDLVKRLEK